MGVNIIAPADIYFYALQCDIMAKPNRYKYHTSSYPINKTGASTFSPSIVIFCIAKYLQTIFN